ncbi:glycosyltransferase [Photobacterium makurazakiensis]|uniref:glycosyltransferase family 2 protein n=1 Tax=Photobacterium makurazakiensis TaxID=2910234 RepID=UPI003D1469EE
MKVSIITPSFNCEKWIEKTYRTIRDQSHSNFEWIVTDDCSTDESYGILKRLAESDERIILKRNTVNSGAAVTRNNSISYASGEFIAFIDSDDLWLPNKLAKQVSFMTNNSIDFSFTSYELIDETGVRIGASVDTHLTEPVSYKDMLRKKATLGCSTVMLRRSKFDDLSMPLIRTGQDYALWLKLLKTGTRAHAYSDVLTQYRIVPNSISRNKFKKAKRQWEIYRKIERLSLLESVECFVFYAYRAVFRK